MLEAREMEMERERQRLQQSTSTAASATRLSVSPSPTASSADQSGVSPSSAGSPSLNGRLEGEEEEAAENQICAVSLGPGGSPVCQCSDGGLGNT